ncbi:hypothetical protein MMC26_001520 [Xylographa opegraphella]|nr:hypothetical protein [Xylographa opegraphella]
MRRQLMVTLASNAFLQLNGKELELLQRFHERTVFTISPAKTIASYSDEIVKLACVHPFLMHAAMIVTLLHDRHLATVSDTKLSTTESFHYYRSIALFNSKLTGPLQGSERDALWVAAAILGSVSFCHIEAQTPEEAWPLKPSSALDFNWLSLSEGKLQVWNITNVLETQFRQLALEHMNFSKTIPAGPGLEALPSGLIGLCGIDAASTADNNPYYAVALSVAQALNLTSDYNTNMKFFQFTMMMGLPYKHLLVRKDPCALLLLAYWYAKVCQHKHWWIVSRAALECQAICMFLERYHRHDSNILELLRFPKTSLACLASGDISPNQSLAVTNSTNQLPRQFLFVNTSSIP